MANQVPDREMQDPNVEVPGEVLRFFEAVEAVDWNEIQRIFTELSQGRHRRHAWEVGLEGGKTFGPYDIGKGFPA